MDKYEINFSPKDTVSHLLNVLKINIESLYYGLQLIESEPVLPERLENHDDFFHFQLGEPIPEEDRKKYLNQILLSKCFEDLIKGLTLSLCDAYLLVNFRLFLCNEESLTQEKIEREHKKIDKKSHGKNFPQLIEEIAGLVGGKLPLTEELITINRARNCFVHRRGIVHPEKDLNDKENNKLTTKWLRPYLFQNKEGQEIEMVGGGIVTNEAPAFLKTIQQEKSFDPYETISFSYKEILEIAHTFYLFASGLIEGQIRFLKDNPVA